MKTIGTVTALLTLVGCVPGYIKPADLEKNKQGPGDCARSCEQLGMRMTAFVLVGAAVPGCVCQPVAKVPPAPAPLPPPAAPEVAPDGAAAATAGYVVIEAARRQAEQQHQQAKK